MGCNDLAAPDARGAVHAQWGRARALVLWTLLQLLLWSGGCAPPQDALMPHSGMKPVATQTTAGTTGGAGAAKAGVREAASAPLATPQGAKPSGSGAGEPTLFRDWSVYVERAHAQLLRPFDGFMEREDAPWSMKTFARLWSDMGTFWDQLVHISGHEWGPLQIGQLALPLTVVGVLILLFLLLDRQSAVAAHRFQSRYHTRSPNLTRLARMGITLGAHVGPLLPPLLLSYFPVRALFGPTPWALMVAGTFWVLIGLRLALGLVESALGTRLLRLADTHAHPLDRTLNFWLNATACFGFALVFVRSLGNRPELLAALAFSFKLALALIPLSAFRLREAVLAIVPTDEDSRSYSALRRSLVQNFRGLMGVTTALLVMRALGYVHAAHFLLLRGWSLIFVLLAATLGLHKLRRAMSQRVEQMDPRDPQIEMYTGIGRLLNGGGLLVTISAALHITALLQPSITLLKLPLIVVQGIEFSIFNVLSAAIITGAAALVSRVVRLLLNTHIYPSMNVDVGVAYAVNTLLSYAIVVVGFFLVLVALGVNLSALTVVLASLSVGIGFGLQTLTENLISGFIILFGRAVQKGDYITIDGTYGRIEAVGARSVVLRTTDNVDMLIPSKELVAKSITNWTYRDTIVRLHIPVGVTYKADPHRVRKVLLEAALEHEHVMPDPAPEVWLTGFGDSSVNFDLLVYFDCRVTVADRIRGQLNFYIWDALHEAGIEIPFPQRDLHIRTADGLGFLREP